MAKKRVKVLQLSIICGLLSIQLPVLSAQDNGQVLAEETAPQQAIIATPTVVMTPAESLAQITSSLPADVKPVFSSQIAKIYADRQMKLLWQDETAIEQFQQQLAELALSGVQPQFSEWLVALENTQLSELGRDVMLSDAMLGYLQYLSGVSANGQFWLYQKKPYNISAPTVEQMKPWLESVAENNLSEWVKAQAPQHALYQPMRQEMLKQLNMNDDGLELVETKTLKPGQSSDDVITLREILYRQGFIDAAAISTEIDAAASEEEKAKATAQARLYSEDLIEPVKKFQQSYGLEADGMVGKGTKVWLNMKPQQKAGLMALNIQRLRIIPEDSGTGILVNIPAFSLNFYLNDDVILDSKVIVGRPDRKTPIMSSALNNVVINPPWSVPTSMARKDIAPRGKQDPSYFSRKGYTVYSGWGQDSFEIDPYSINWDEITPANFPYRIRQAPGPTNSLGRYKFNMPSSDAIYLHDTPNHSLFNRSARAISSGCVRVNKANELASILLGDAGWEQKRIDGAVKAGSTRYVNIPDRIPVYLYYQTAWVDKEQKPQYRADIYQYDNSIENVEKQLPVIKSFLH
ncbi:L,D-transpeptidase [Providencia stuartii]|uniref:L,D-transpeptidase n=1 Tax=Providencia stuartii TaxID=588 RepID=UPI0018C47D67|nr:L,D-transpeptidase [Providencia stuartii]MBG5920997.1 L,D-transpeptidase [Providencia stuartii]